MAATNSLNSEDQFLCSICLDVFTDPVTVPCGHNFCKNCITENWEVNDENLCPMCQMIFITKPELHVNTLISKMVAQFRAKQDASSSSSEQQAAKPGEVPCDVCTGTKLKALKSCLVCLVSYCETHLEPHLTDSNLNRHQLIEPVGNLIGRTCAKHKKPLELFCKTDQTCFCMHCPLYHKGHEFVLLRDGYKEKKKELGKTGAELQQMIQKRQLKIQAIENSLDLSEKDEDRAISQGVQIFTSLKETVERGLNGLINGIENKHKTLLKLADEFIKELEEEVSDLMKRSTEVENLLRAGENLKFLPSIQSLEAAPPTKDWTEVSICPPSYEATVVRAVAQLEGTLSEKMKMLFEAELRRLQQFAVDLTFDPDTAHPDLILSDDLKQVTHGDERMDLPDNKKRFFKSICVLGKQSFTSGRFYYEVRVRGKTEWTLGVVNESINRKGDITLNPEHGCWTIWLRNANEYKALVQPAVSISLMSRPQTVGVFVDYEEGLVSFYDIDALSLIYSFTGCCFTGKLLPYFNPCHNSYGTNSAPLIISSVRHTDQYID